MRRRIVLLGALATSFVFAQAAPAVAGALCDPIQTESRFRGQVPSLAEAVPNPGGNEGEVTTAQAYRYMDTVDRASNRVITGSLKKKSWQGRRLRWAIVGRPEHLGPRSLEKIRRAAQKLRDPRTSPDSARKIAQRHPAILWVASALHGEEESGAEASLRVLHELADRNDCAADRILDNSIVVILPVQNPDGREVVGSDFEERFNAYGFDLNRDWVARTQPETDAKLTMLRKYPGPLFIDAHESRLTDFFFPPNPDPIYHEVSDQSLRWVEGYGAAMAAEFDRQEIDHFSRDVFDLLYVGYGDTTTTSAFLSAGMSFEASGFKPISERAYEHYLAIWVSLSEAAMGKKKILKQWAAAYRKAYRQGRRGRLEPNAVVNPGNEVVTKVPERPLRHYFIRKTGDKRAEARALVRRLQRMDVNVYRLSRGLRVPDYTPYGRRTRAIRLPAGTWYIPMAQGQKHWIQAMLHEDTYVPFPYFVGPQAWSQPLLFNLKGGFSGRKLRVNASRVEPIKEPAPPAPPADPPRIALLEVVQVARPGWASSGWLRYLIEQVWGMAYTDVSGAAVSSGALDAYDVLMIPDGIAALASNDLGAAGKQELRDWVNGGGHLISWRGGTELAAELGLTTAVLADPKSDVPGSLIRVRVSKRSPLSRGVGDLAYASYDYDKVMRASADRVKVWFPPTGSGDWFVSGFAAGAEELGGTAAVVDEPIGAGRSTVFTVEPNLIANAPGFQKILRNALLRGDAGIARADEAGSSDTAQARRAAALLTGNTATIRLSVQPASADSAEAVLERFGARYQVERDPDRVAFLIQNRRGLSAEEHPFVGDLPAALEEAGVETIALRAP